MNIQDVTLRAGDIWQIAMTFVVVILVPLAYRVAAILWEHESRLNRHEERISSLEHQKGSANAH